MTDSVAGYGNQMYAFDYQKGRWRELTSKNKMSIFAPKDVASKLGRPSSGGSATNTASLSLSGKLAESLPLTNKQERDISKASLSRRLAYALNPVGIFKDAFGIGRGRKGRGFETSSAIPELSRSVGSEYSTKLLLKIETNTLRTNVAVERLLKEFVDFKENYQSQESGSTTSINGIPDIPNLGGKRGGRLGRAGGAASRAAGASRFLPAIMGLSRVLGPLALFAGAIYGLKTALESTAENMTDYAGQDSEKVLDIISEENELQNLRQMGGDLGPNATDKAIQASAQGIANREPPKMKFGGTTVANQAAKRAASDARAAQAEAERQSFVQDKMDEAGKPYQKLAGKGLDTKGLEGFRSNVYNDPAGYPTIGYGHKLTSDELKSGFITLPDGTKINWKAGEGLTKDQASSLMNKDKSEHSDAAAKKLMNYGIDVNSLSPNVRDALNDLAFNAGPGIFDKTPKLLDALRANDTTAIASELRTTARTSGGEVLPGLVSRANSRADYVLGGPSQRDTGSVVMASSAAAMPATSSGTTVVNAPTTNVSQGGGSVPAIISPAGPRNTDSSYGLVAFNTMRLGAQYS